MLFRMSRSLIPLLLVIAGCGQQMNSFYQTSKLALIGQPDTQVSAAYVDKLPYASIYLKIGKAQRGFVVLGEANQHYLKWYSADHAMVMTHFGRVVKTVGLTSDLNFSSDADADPLAHPQTLLTMKGILHWNHQEFAEKADIRSGLQYQSTFANDGMDTINVLDKPRQVVRIEENVYVPALQKNYQNQYWLDPATGAVVQSEQYLFPADTLVQLTVLKPYAG